MSKIKITNNQDIDLNKEISLRKAKLSQIRQEQKIAFPNSFKPTDQLADLSKNYDKFSKEQLAKKNITVKVAGRIMRKRVMGKASFAHIQDSSGLMQIYLTRDDLVENLYNQGFKKWDIGDIVGLTGLVFKTNTGELSIHVNHIELLVKNLHPLPDKFHGLKDTELRYRQRYVDLMMNKQVRDVFVKRSKIIHTLRQILNNNDFLEVETPMMHPIIGGANARPFNTHHNALDIDLFLRIAPELYLKRLIVGGYDRVYEINRNFRNEGISTRHNPEFTMVEFYQAYATFEDLIEFTENIIRTIAKEVLGSTTVHYQDKDYDLTKSFQKMTLLEAICHFNPQIKSEDLQSSKKLIAILQDHKAKIDPNWSLGKLQTEVFESSTEHKLDYPIFITHYPIDVSPLSRKNDHNPHLADRFEFFIAGKEIANGFSELNDPEDQAARFKAQVQAAQKGYDEAMQYDSDYIEALMYGMPPTAGEGIGIDRLVMFFTDSASIRDVLFFPLLKPKV